MSNRSVYIETYGCQMNVLDSELVQHQLQGLGYSMAEASENADVVLLNTCSVRELSEHKVWSHLGRLANRKKKGENIVVGVLGCMAERARDEFAERAPQIDVICGPSNLDQLPELIHDAVGTKSRQTALSGHISRRERTREEAVDRLETLDMSRTLYESDCPAQAYVRITRGCNKFCSFCVVPFTRGPEVHRRPEAVVDEVRRLADSGVIEVTLLGQTVNHYEWKDGGKTTSFADLLRKVHDEVPAIKRLRFLTSYPRDFSDDALDAMRDSERMCRYLHIPAQSGSNRMLKLMNRGYTIESYFELLERARSRMPDIRLAGDMIVGYPGETEEDHLMSVEMLRQAKYKSCFIFKYSPRPGTVSVRRDEDDVPVKLKKQRNAELLAVQSEVSLVHHQALIGQELEVLVDSQSKFKSTSPLGAVPQTRWIGRSGGDEIVAFDGPEDLMGALVRVKVRSASALSLSADMVERTQGGRVLLRKGLPILSA